MREKLTNFKFFITSFLTRYNIPLPIAALLVVFLLSLLLLPLFFIASTPTSQQEENPSPTQYDNAQTNPSTPKFPTDGPPPTTLGTPTPTTNPDVYYQNNNAYKDSVDSISEEEQVALSKDKAVSNFMDSLPYQGNYMRASYSISDNVVRVVLKGAFQTQGNTEFDNLLKKYGIQSRSWIPDLQITTE